MRLRFRYCDGRCCAMMKAEGNRMEETMTPQPTLKTRADYEAATQRCLEEMDRLNELMRRDQVEIDRLKAETRAILDKLRAE